MYDDITNWYSVVDSWEYEDIRKKRNPFPYFRTIHKAVQERMLMLSLDGDRYLNVIHHFSRCIPYPIRPNSASLDGFGVMIQWYCLMWQMLNNWNDDGTESSGYNRLCYLDPWNISEFKTGSYYYILKEHFNVADEDIVSIYRTSDFFKRVDIARWLSQVKLVLDSMRYISSYYGFPLNYNTISSYYQNGNIFYNIRLNAYTNWYPTDHPYDMYNPTTMTCTAHIFHHHGDNVWHKDSSTGNWVINTGECNYCDDEMVIENNYTGTLVLEPHFAFRDLTIPS